MRHIYGALLFLSVIFGFVSGPVHAQSFTSKELIEMADFITGGKVTYKGEAVTAIMNRGEYSWVNLNDGDNAIGIWCKRESLKDVRFLGDYKNKGDVLEVKGIFHRACPIHGGELDIHADSVRVVASGAAVGSRFSGKRIKAAITFFILALLSIVALRKRI